MEKHGRTIKIIILIVNIILSIGILYLDYKEYIIYKKDNKNIENIKINYQEIINENTKLKEEISIKKNELNKLNDINKLITDEKNSVFKLASEVEHKIQNKEIDKKIAYLTFDDGPYYNTLKILKILKENKVKATFFTTNVNGEFCFDNSSYNCHSIYKKIANENHTIANHTYTHGWNRGLYSSTTSFIDAVIRQEELIKKYTGITTNIVRFPGGSNTVGKKVETLALELKKHNYGWIDWTSEDGDGRNLSSYNQGWNMLKNTVTDNIEVVLLHDYHPITTQILPNFIKDLEDNGYIILPLFYESIMVNK